MGKAVILKAGGKTDVISLKTSIVGNLKDGETIVLIDSIGMVANYVATKAIILARGSMSSLGYTLEANPFFKEYKIKDPVDSKVKTGICWMLKGIKKF